MMIPSEMPVLSQSRGENGHASFADNSNVFQNQQDVFRSGIFGQLGSEQMQMLQNLQQMGQKVKKEVGHFLLPHVRSQRVVFCVLASPVLCWLCFLITLSLRLFLSCKKISIKTKRWTTPASREHLSISRVLISNPLKLDGLINLILL